MSFSLGESIGGVVTINSRLANGRDMRSVDTAPFSMYPFCHRLEWQEVSTQINLNLTGTQSKRRQWELSMLSWHVLCNASLCGDPLVLS